ncbi:glycosyltransferase family 4 protein [Algoriphagus sp.]|uniref:glycosyltransferase family 4 protein n=1 Tax=Algoriphagus sp. TaxID=1872435 RepID=UPI00391BD915
MNQEIEEQAGANDELKEEFKVLMLASLRPYKGVNEFLKLAEEMPQIGFDLILSDSKEDVDFWKLKSNIPENLTILSVQNNVIPWYKSASVVINLTHKDECLETFGMTILEGMKFGLPSIVPTAGGVTELVLDGQNGFQIDYYDLDEIKRVVEEMQTNFQFWQGLSQHALEHSRKFSRENFNEKMSQLLRFQVAPE